RTFLLDTIDPDSLRAFDEMLHFDTTLFVFANKSGKPIEAHSLLLYFLERLKMMGIHSPAHHFITRTEENSYLGQLAGEYDFLDSFLDPPGIHGRYSSLALGRPPKYCSAGFVRRSNPHLGRPAVLVTPGPSYLHTIGQVIPRRPRERTLPVAD